MRELLLILAFSDSYKQTMLPFSKIISNNINISREIFTLFLSSNETRLAFSEIYYKQHNTTQFFTSSYQTILQLSGGYYQTILHTCFQSPYQIILILSESYYKIILHTFCQSSYQTIMTLSEQYYQTRYTFCQSSHKTILIQGCHSFYALKIEEIWGGITNIFVEICQNLA